jgi:hypothetical protein
MRGEVGELRWGKNTPFNSDERRQTKTRLSIDREEEEEEDATKLQNEEEEEEERERVGDSGNHHGQARQGGGVALFVELNISLHVRSDMLFWCGEIF